MQARRWPFFVLLVTIVNLLLPLPAPAATILEKTLRHAIQPDGSVLETTTLRVRLESERDVAAWDAHWVPLDENRELVEIRTSAVLPDGEEVVVKKKDHDVTEAPGRGVLHGSQTYHRVEFPALPVGSLLAIEHTVRETPYFPGNRLPLGEDDPIAVLRVEITGAADLRWHLDDDTRAWGDEALKMEEIGDGLRLVGEGLPAAEVPALAPADAAYGPVLLYGWGGPAASWQDVAAWYGGLIEALPSSPAVAEEALALVAGLDDPRQKLDALLTFASEKVRYVAVEMGIGGYRPSPPPETLERRWGDCKDKATLLVRMLGEVGIEAYPALILSARDRRIDPRAPNPFQFNHAVVAVPVEGLAVEEGDPVADGLLFVDPTDDRGTSRWIHPGVQDQDALVVRGEGSGLVRTPILSDRDRRELFVELAAGTGSGGVARGRAELTLSGRFGRALLDLLAGEKTDRIEETLRAVLGAVLPGATLSRVSWGQDASRAVPWVALQAEVEIPGLVQGSGERRSLDLPGVVGTPEPAQLEDRALPVVLSPGVVRESWQITLPPGWCPRQTDPTDVVNELGSFRQTLGGEETSLTLLRSLELRRRWVEPSELDALRELSLAELKARKRRVRLQGCGG